MSIDGIPITSLPPSVTRQLTSKQDSSSRSKPSKPNLLKILREAVGKDFTRITIPVYFNEPLSFLQRACEDVEHSWLLDQAAHPSLARSSKRAALVAAFVISHYSATAGRTGKPFNPLLGETFDFIQHNNNSDSHTNCNNNNNNNNNKGTMAIVTEQVSHHPPVTALHAVGKGWQYHTAYRLKSKFHGNTFEAWPEGKVHIRFDNGNDHFCYEQAHTFVNNLVVGGSLWIDNVGTINIEDVGNKRYKTWIKLKPRNSSMMFSSGSEDSKSLGAVTGEVSAIFSSLSSSSSSSSSSKKSKKSKSSSTTQQCHKIVGNWRKEVCIDGNIVWTALGRIDKDCTAGHVMTEWAWNLNALSMDKNKNVIPKTDSRLRPDERALEQGDYDRAAKEKDRLERAQRERRKEKDGDGNSNENLTNVGDGNGNGNDDNYKARWFVQKEDEDSGQMEWRYKGGYFEAKMAAVKGKTIDSSTSMWLGDDDIDNIF